MIVVIDSIMQDINNLNNKLQSISQTLDEIQTRVHLQEERVRDNLTIQLLNCFPCFIRLSFVSHRFENALKLEMI